MARRTFAVGDIHGDLAALTTVLGHFPPLDGEDTIVFLGDYVDRGPASAQVVDFIRRELPGRTPARIVCIRGSHEDAWLKVRRSGWVEFVLPAGNGCLATLRSYQGRQPPRPDEIPSGDDFTAMLAASFFPDDVIAWFDALPCYYEDEHAIYVHAGLPMQDGRWLHPAEVADPRPLMWQRKEAFFRTYHGKRVVFGHTSTEYLPQELSCYTPDDHTDLFAGPSLLGVDTGCGHEGGFLTAVELPSLQVYESRAGVPALGPSRTLELSY